MTMSEFAMETNGSGKPRAGLDDCPLCDGTGLRMEVRPGTTASGKPAKLRVAVPCECRTEQRAAHGLLRARIPKRYEHCTLESYEIEFEGANSSLIGARATAQQFVDGYPIQTYGMGVLLTGSIGVGKTHLATGMLNAVMQQKGATGLFCDYRDLLKQIQHSYNPQTAVTEMDVLQPVFDAEVLVLDELGASKPTEWVWDTVAHILNTRYNDKRTTILTTNFANSPAGAQQSTVARAVAQETLGDRIGDRMRSRLLEMCVVVEMRGKDYREKVSWKQFA
jgi:DNA replication protein DnaC